MTEQPLTTQPSPRVLVAEDNAATAGVVQFSLERAGCEVVLASDGHKAIEAVTSTPFDVIMTDFQMPGASGEEVIRAARMETPNARTPLILCSAKGLELDTERLAEEYSLARVVFKPFSPRDIVSLVLSLASVPAGTR